MSPPPPWVLVLALLLSMLEGSVTQPLLDPRDFPLPRLHTDRRLLSAATRPLAFLDLGVGFDNPSNPYCRMCTNLFNIMVEKQDATAEKLCQTQPLNSQRQCALLAASMKASSQVKTLLEGCTDTTGNFKPQLQEDKRPVITESNGIRATPCPGVIACNILEAHSGAPMCGYKLRGWGDFYYESGVGNPIRPSMQDTWGGDGATLNEGGSVVPVNFAPPPWSRISGGNQDCDMCIDTYTVMSVKYPEPGEGGSFLRRRRRLLQEAPAKPLLCMNQPISMIDYCTKFSTAFSRNVDAIKLLVDGCIDKTTTVITETDNNGCSAEVACNIIRAPNGGPYCGDVLRRYGDFTGQPPNHNWNLKAQPLA